MTDPRRRIPGVDRLLEDAAFGPLLEAHPRGRVVGALRELTEAVRGALDGGGDPPGGAASSAASLADPDALGDPAAWAREAGALLGRRDRPSLRPVINATGVVLHTNLGRAPLAPEVRDAMARAATGYGNLEYDLEAGERGSRYVHCADLVRELTGAEDALVVNNNAAALVLALNTLARGKGVLVSRGELVEIGGGFRIPAMLERAGTRLVEVGSTNRTRVGDYREAIEAGGPDGIALILKVHRSNFRIAGFTEEASLEALAPLASASGIPLVHDLGSGLLADPEALGLPPEPRAGESLAAGADVVCVSADKLMGGPQAGILAGRAALVERMRTNPLCRALRVDKVTLAGLEATLRLYRDPDEARRRIPALAALSAPPGEVEARARRTAEALEARGVPAEVAEGASVVGGGTYPGVEIPSWTVRLDPGMGGGPGTADEAARRLRAGRPPVVGRVEEDRIVMDLRTVAPEEEEALVTAIEKAWTR